MGINLELYQVAMSNSQIGTLAAKEENHRERGRG